MSTNYITVDNDDNSHDDSDNDTVIEIPSPTPSLIPRTTPTHLESNSVKKFKDLAILNRWNICCFISLCIAITIIIIVIVVNL